MGAMSMRRIMIDDKGRQPVVMVEGMPSDASVHYLGRSDRLFYLVERSGEGFRLHVGERTLTPSHIKRSYSAVDIGAHVLNFDHEYARGDLFFNDEGTSGFIYHADSWGGIVGQENLSTVLPQRPREAWFPDVRYVNPQADVREREERPRAT